MNEDNNIDDNKYFHVQIDVNTDRFDDEIRNSKWLGEKSEKN